MKAGELTSRREVTVHGGGGIALSQIWAPRPGIPDLQVRALFTIRSTGFGFRCMGWQNTKTLNVATRRATRKRHTGRSGMARIPQESDHPQNQPDRPLFKPIWKSCFFGMKIGCVRSQPLTMLRRQSLISGKIQGISSIWAGFAAKLAGLLSYFRGLSGNSLAFPVGNFGMPIREFFMAISELPKGRH